MDTSILLFLVVRVLWKIYSTIISGKIAKYKYLLQESFSNETEHVMLKGGIRNIL